MKYEDNDFLEVNFDLYANDVLYSTTDIEKAKGEKITLEKNNVIILGKNRILKELDEDIKSNYKDGETKILLLSPEKAFGKKKKDLLVVFKEETFKKNKLRAIVGGVYNFGDKMGVVKSISGARILIDFNSPLASKNIKIVYKVIKKIEDLTRKIVVLLEKTLKIPKDRYKYENGKIFLDEEIFVLKEVIKTELEGVIAETKDIVIEKLEKVVKK